MQLKSSQYNGAQVLNVDDNRIDASVAVQFKATAQELTSSTSGRVILDLSNVTLVDSSGLGAIVGSMKQLGRGRRLDLVGLNPAVDKVFKMTRMDSVFQIFETLDEATQETANAS